MSISSAELKPVDVLPFEASSPGLDWSRAPSNEISTPRPAPSTPSFAARWNDRLLGIYGFIVLLALWEFGPRLGWIKPQFFPPLSHVLAEGWKLLARGELPIHIAVSLGRTLSGLGAAIGIAVPLGFVLAGHFPRATRFLQPLFTLFAQVNAFSLFPIFVLFFGIGEVAKFAIICWACLWPLLVGTIRGVSSVDPQLVRAARTMGCNGVALLTQVLLPAALPAILTAARIGALVAFLMLVAAEMVGASTGLGWMVLNAQVNYFMERLYLAVLLIALLGLALQRTLLAVEHRLVYWAGVNA